MVFYFFGINNNTANKRIYDFNIKARCDNHMNYRTFFKQFHLLLCYVVGDIQ